MENQMQKPQIKPNNPNFSSGPCSKRPGWSVDVLKDAYLGRSHRAKGPKAQLKAVIEKHRDLLGIPADYKIGIVPASDTGAFEMALWSMLGARVVDVFAWENFGITWRKDITDHLKLDDVNVYETPYGRVPDFSKVNPENDVIFTWNGTTGGACVPDGDWISADRAGLSFCDATSAVFAYDMPWDKLDVTTWSWQKCLGGEAGHGMLVLSPRAVERLENYVSGRPLPKIFRMTNGGKLNQGIFEGATINTPSMLAVQDCMDALNWVEGIGGVSQTIARSTRNLAAIEDWVEKQDGIEFLVADPSVRSRTSVCLKFTDSDIMALEVADQWAFTVQVCNLLEQESVAFDIKNHKDSLPGLRIWCGGTIETADVEAVLPWISWAYAQAKAEKTQAAA